MREDELLDGIGAVVWEADASSLRFSFVSEHVGQLLGYPPERWLSDGSAWGDHLHPDDREEARARVASAVESGSEAVLEHRAVTADGRVLWLREVIRVDGRKLRGITLDVTRRALSERDVRFHAHLLDAVDTAVVAIDLRGAVTHWNRGAERCFGWSRDEALGRDIREIGIVDDARFADAKMRALTSGKPYEGEFRARRRDGSSFPCYTRDVPLRDDDGHLTGFVGVANDISGRKQAERAIAESERRFRRLVEQAADGFFVLDAAGRFVDASERGARSLGYTRDELLGLTVRDVDAALGRETLAELYSKRAGEPPLTLETVYRRKDGTTFPAELRVGVLDSGGGEPLFLALARDISDRKRAEEQIAYLSRYDSITGLPNRGLFEEHLELALARARRTGRHAAVLYVDLNRFHLVNESLGRAAGDEVLRQAASRLREVARTMDLVARHGADEFLILLPDLDTDPGTNGAGHDPAEDVADEMARLAYEALDEPFVAHGAESFVGASIGIAMFPADGGYPDDLMNHAAAAVQEVRRAGRAPWGMIAGEPEERRERLRFVTRLRKALDRSELVLHYQPMLDLPSALERLRGGGSSLRPAMTGVEALIRWRDPERGVVPPADFIPVVEEMGLIQQVADWVVDEACRQSRAWLDGGWALNVGVNLSPRQPFEPELVRRMVDSAARVGIPPERLVLEITESAAMESSETTMQALHALRAHGFRMAIDDFGAGHSSLARLGALPVDSLKIDRSFVAGLPGDATSTMMVTAIVQLARNLGMGSVAEGIETLEQLEFLVGAGCERGQGFLFSKPVPPEVVASL